MVFYNLYAKPSFAVPCIAFGISEIDGVWSCFAVLIYTVFNGFHNGWC
jgi:hypothetical protein